MVKFVSKDAFVYIVNDPKTIQNILVSVNRVLTLSSTPNLRTFKDFLNH